jgi:hypothetical protein
MAVKDVLDKITERNSDVVGCIAVRGDRVYHNLDAFEVDCTRISETMADLLAISDMVDEMEEPVSSVFTEYDGNCIVAQRMDDDLLIAVTDHLQRGGYKKLQVGLSLQARLLGKALEEDAALPADVIPAAEPEKAVATSALGSTWSKLVSAVVAPVPDAPAPVSENTEGKKKRYYRGQVYYE